MNKHDWIIKFRRAKTLDTLELMSDRAQSPPNMTISNVADVVLAQCHREREILTGKLLQFR